MGRSKPRSNRRAAAGLRIGEIVVKNGPNSALVVLSGGASEFVPVPEVVVPVDTLAGATVSTPAISQQDLRAARRPPPPRSAIASPER